jgi:O-acetyl-ADP-ribose deacetylase (regulator of RNase III)
MIHYVVGDLLESDCNVMVHCCNCFCAFGAGIALQIRHKFPEAYEADQNTTRGDMAKLGTYEMVSCVDRSQRHGDVTVVNLYGQYNYGGRGVKRGGRQVDYVALERAIGGLANQLESWRDRPKIGMPRLGCGLAGGKWSVVGGILLRNFKDQDIYVYDLRDPEDDDE